MNIHVYWDLIKTFETEMIKRDPFNKHRLKRTCGIYVIDSIDKQFQDFMAPYIEAEPIIEAAAESKKDDYWIPEIIQL